MAKVAPFLWFPGNMQEALGFYRSVFKDRRSRQGLCRMKER